MPNQPPWLSETVKELEHQLKVTLFVRTTRSVELTEAGRVFSGQLAHVLDDLDDAVRGVQRMAARSGQALTLGYVIGEQTLPRPLSGHGRHSPNSRSPPELPVAAPARCGGPSRQSC